MGLGTTYIELDNMITEGRKEDLIAKYGPSEELLNDYLGNSEIHIRTNYKYADWYLKQYYKSDSDIERIEDGDEVLSKFHKYGKNLEKKDINQYKSYSELVDVISQYESQRKETVSNEDSIKLVDNDDIIIVRPLTHQSSCKYGSGTKWCTTHKDDKYFNQYDEKGNLYYIHLKKVGKDNSFYKMAAYLTYDGQREEWYDAQDKMMGDGEVKLAKLLVKPESMDLIRQDLHSTIESRPKPITKHDKILKKIIDEFQYVTEFSFPIDINGDTFVFDFEASGEMEIYDGNRLPIYFMLSDEVTGEDGEGYMVGDMVFEVSEHGEVRVKFVFESGTKAFEWIMGKTFAYGIKNTALDRSSFIKVIKKAAERALLNPETLNNLKGYGNDKFWRATNRMSSYKFTGSGALTKSFKEYMNNLGPEGLGSKVDFLTSIGRIEANDEGGYSRVGGGPIVIGGYLSTFFSSLKDAGIIEYVRQGRRYMFKQGPNYNNFIEGSLKRV